MRARHFRLVAGGKAEALTPERLLAVYRKRGTAEVWAEVAGLPPPTGAAV